MSTRIMAQCWPLQMAPAAKSVLMSLADNANDHGECYPSIAYICERTCYKKDAVINAIAWLEKAGALIANRENGRHTTYTLTPKKFVDFDAEKRRETTRRKPPVKTPKPLGQTDSFEDGDHSAKTTGRPKPPVDMADRHHSAKTTDRSAKPTKPVGQTDTNRHEPSLEPSLNHYELPQDGNSAGDSETALQAACRATWDSYRNAYAARYGIQPVRNAKVNGQIKQIVQRIGYTDAPIVADFFLRLNDQFVVKRTHDLGTLLANAEGYRTQCLTGSVMTNTKAQQLDRTASNFDAVQEAIRMSEQRGTA